MPAPAAAAPADPLGHAGRWITDAEGKVAVLHGFNTVPANEATLPGDMGMGVDNAEWLAENGFNTIRLGLYYARVEPQPGVYDDAYLDDYLRVQSDLADEGIFTLLGMHQDQLNPRYGTGGSLPSRGFPDWFLKEDGLPNTATPYPQGYLTNPALNRAYDNIWQDFDAADGASIHEHFAAGWQRVASAFEDRPRLLGYDFFNEPWPGTLWPLCANPVGCPPGGFDQTLLTSFNQELTAALRATDSDHLIFYEPNLLFDYGAATGVGDPGDENAGFSFHDYCLSFAIPGLPSPGPCELGEALVLDNAEAQSRRTGDALLVTEFALDPDSASRMTRLLDKRMLSWQAWDYYGDSEGSLHIAVSPILIRPYPQLIAGTPRHWSFDRPSKTFDFTYAPDRAIGEGALAGAPERFAAGSKTEIFVPELHYPGGYGVAVEGAEVVSSPEAHLLVLRSCPGADLMQVQLTPAPRPAPKCDAPTPRACQFRVVGSPRADRLAGGPFGDRLVGRGGTDRLSGRRGDDCLAGGRGADMLRGGPGSDRLRGGRGPDLLRARDDARDHVRCGRGNDHVRVDPFDRVRGCE